MNYLSLQEIQEEELKLLLRLTRFLDEKGLRYSLHAGTLLGAVRHGGFIPWDDDVDIAMPRPDYERFRKVSEELPEDMFFMHDGNSAFPLRFGKVCTKEVRAQQEFYDDILDEYLWIDVFPIDGLPDDAEGQKAVFKQALLNRRKRLYLTLDSRVSSNKLKGLVASAYRLLPFKQVRSRRLDSQFYELISERDFDSCEYITSSLSSDGNSLWVGRREDLCKWEKISFCGHMLSTYSNTHWFLTKGYGDYMTLPPESERQTHSMKCWRTNDC